MQNAVYDRHRSLRVGLRKGNSSHTSARRESSNASNLWSLGPRRVGNEHHNESRDCPKPPEPRTTKQLVESASVGRVLMEETKHRQEDLLRFPMRTPLFSHFLLACFANVIRSSSFPGKGKEKEGRRRREEGINTQKGLKMLDGQVGAPLAAGLTLQGYQVILRHTFSTGREVMMLWSNRGDIIINANQIGQSDILITRQSFSSFFSPC